MMNTTNEPLRSKISHIRLDLLHFGHAIVGRKWAGSCINPAFSRLYYILFGSAVLVGHDGIRTVLSKGEWVLLPSGYSFDFSCEDQLNHIYFHLTLCDVDEIDRLSSFSMPVTLSDLPDESEDFASLIRSESLSDGLLLRHRVEKIILAFLASYHIGIEENKLSPCVLRAIRYIKQQLSVSLTLDDIAAHAFVSKSTLTKHFRKELAVSVCAYVMNAALFESAQQLLKTDLSVLEISEKYGFSDPFYFSRRFKEKFGISPLRYRKAVIS